MNFAVLGDDPSALPLIRAIAAAANHRLTHIAAGGALPADVLSAAPRVRACQSWEELLLDPPLDAVIVCGDGDAIAEGAKQLAAAGKAILFFPRASQGSTLIYELTLIHDDNRTLLFPALPLRAHPNVRRARDVIAGQQLGPLLHVRLQREQPPDSGALFTPQDVDAALLPDVDLLRMLGGNYSQVTALQTVEASGGIARATVNLTGDRLPDSVWTLDVAAATRWSLSVTGQRGSFVLHGTADPSAITWEGQFPAGSAAPAPVEAFDPGTVLLEQFESAAAGHPVSPDWTDLTRAFEIVDATHQSVRRRRTIDLHFETTSERSLFKTQMTAIGCALLSVTFFAVLFVLVAATLFDPRGRREAQSEAVGFIVYADEFVAGEAELNPQGRNHVAQIASRLPTTTALVLVEQTGTADDEINRARREAAVAQLEHSGVSDAASRTEVAALAGKWFLPAMRIARVAVFVPLFIYLLLQLLLFVTRPALRKTNAPAPPNES